MSQPWPPADMPARVAALAAGVLPVAVPRHAATVVLLRDTADGLEALLLRRVSSMAFAAGMHVFPGGSVEPADHGWVGALPEGWTAQLGAPDEQLARALVGAAVRETWEECGVSLAVGGVGLAGGLSGVRLRADLLRPWAHWVTPEVEPRRFDTRFFVAALPAGQRVRRGDGESDDARWVRPADAPALPMLPPTARTLAELAAFPDVASVLAAPRRLRPVMPRFAVDAAGLHLLLPDDPGYATAPGGTGHRGG